MLTPCGAGENSAVPTLLPIPSCRSSLAVFCADDEKADEITTAAVIAIILCSRIVCGVYANPIELFALKNFPGLRPQVAQASACGSWLCLGARSSQQTPAG